MKLTVVEGFRLTEIAAWAQLHLGTGTRVVSDGLARQLQKIFIGESVQPDIHALSWPMWHVVQVHHL